MRAAALLLGGLLAACGQAGDQPVPAATASEAVTPSEAATPSEVATPSLPAPPSLVGEYRVAGIDGAEFNQSYGIALSIDEGELSYEPTCAGFRWSYSYRDGTLDLERRQEMPDQPGPPVVCAVAVPPELDQLAAVLDAVDRAGVTPANGIELSGNGRSVLLFSQ